MKCDGTYGFVDVNMDDDVLILLIIIITAFIGALGRRVRYWCEEN